MRGQRAGTQAVVEGNDHRDQLEVVRRVAGGVLGRREARKLKPMGRRRDAVLGWSIVGLLVTPIAVAVLTASGTDRA